LLYACNENRLLLYKGFGEKTQQNIKESIEFYLSNQGSYLFAQIEKYAAESNEKIKTALPNNQFELAGDFRRHLEIIEKLEWVTTTKPKDLRDFFTANEYEVVSSTETESQFKGKENVLLVFYHTVKEKFIKLFLKKAALQNFWKHGLKNIHLRELMIQKKQS
jgi:DNA polymerase (family 10)